MAKVHATQREKNELYIKENCIDINTMKSLLVQDFKGYEIVPSSINVIQNKTTRLNFMIRNELKNETKLSLMASSKRVDGKLKIFVNKKSYDNAVLKFNENLELIDSTADDLQLSDNADVAAEMTQ